ncbi:MAG: rubredoxin [Nitrospirae bacterium]|uniref:rubredoxin n=1 Tax=Candidatus Magnetobacterium casense TaxID=1455061 RepID=UPI00058D13FB|nr:rubredoxin [Candidatus Magnetobacterium casensis]MBF0337566.1 rubredoxin [Nitrospirota bacterium]
MSQAQESKVYVCGLCGYIYDPKKGDKKSKIPPGVEFKDLPEGWKCPLCGVGVSRFNEML